jgi:hypothetical protein
VHWKKAGQFNNYANNLQQLCKLALNSPTPYLESRGLLTTGIVTGVLPVDRSLNYRLFKNHNVNSMFSKMAGALYVVKGGNTNSV